MPTDWSMSLNLRAGVRFASLCLVALGCLGSTGCSEPEPDARVPADEKAALAELDTLVPMGTLASKVWVLLGTDTVGYVDSRLSGSDTVGSVPNRALLQGRFSAPIPAALRTDSTVYAVIQRGESSEQSTTITLHSGTNPPPAASGFPRVMPDDGNLLCVDVTLKNSVIGVLCLAGSQQS